MELIKLADGSYGIKGRNLLKTSIEKVMVTFGHDEYAYFPVPEDMEGVN